MTNNLTLTPEDCELLIAMSSPFPPPGTWTPGRRDRFIELIAALKSHAAFVPSPLNGDKVWRSARWIVRAKTKAEAMRMLGSVSMYVTPTRFAADWMDLSRCPLFAVSPGVWHNADTHFSLDPVGWVKVWPKNVKC